MPIIAPWLKGTDFLQAAGEGSRLGLQQRQQDDAEAARAMQFQLAQQEHERQRQTAADMLRYHYDAMTQARDLETAKEALRREEGAAARALTQTKNENLADYHAGILQNQQDRIDYLKGKPESPRTFHVGDSLVQVNPTGDIKTLFTKPEAESIPIVSGVKLDPNDPASPSIRLRANDPLLNKYLGTNAAMLGTNFPLTVKMPVKAPLAAPAPDDESLDDEVRDEPTATPEQQVKKLDATTAKGFLNQAKGDKKKARELARQAGYVF